MSLTDKFIRSLLPWVHASKVSENLITHELSAWVIDGPVSSTLAILIEQGDDLVVCLPSDDPKTRIRQLVGQYDVPAFLRRQAE